MSELKSCPFCGSEAEMYVSEIGAKQGDGFWIRCDNCEIEQHGFYSEDEAIERWNRRVT
jgi:Lar family restriction alleviation protein